MPKNSSKKYFQGSQKDLLKHFFSSTRKDDFFIIIGAYYPNPALSSVETLKKEAKTDHLSRQFRLIFRSKTTTSCGSILFFIVQTTFRHHYYTLNVINQWKTVHLPILTVRKFHLPCSPDSLKITSPCHRSQYSAPAEFHRCQVSAPARFLAPTLNHAMCWPLSGNQHQNNRFHASSAASCHNQKTAGQNLKNMPIHILRITPKLFCCPLLITISFQAQRWQCPGCQNSTPGRFQTTADP